MGFNIVLVAVIFCAVGWLVLGWLLDTCTSIAWRPTRCRYCVTRVAQTASRRDAGSRSSRRARLGGHSFTVPPLVCVANGGHPISVIIAIVSILERWHFDPMRRSVLPQCLNRQIAG